MKDINKIMGDMTETGTFNKDGIVFMEKSQYDRLIECRDMLELLYDLGLHKTEIYVKAHKVFESLHGNE